MIRVFLFMNFNKKITYLSANCSYSHSSLAFGQICSYTKPKVTHYSWEFIECTTKDSINEIVLKVLECNTKIFISTVYLFNKCFIFEIIEKLKTLRPNIKVVLGGPEFLGTNKYILNKNRKIDFIIRGDESTFYMLLNSFNASSDNISQIPGLCYIDDNKNYIDNGTAEFDNNDLDFLPSPFDFNFQSKKKPFMQIETSRGCYSKCSFCTSALSKNVKLYSVERVRKELLTLKEAGYKEIRVLDRTFNLPSTRACQLITMFIKEFGDIKFHLEIEPDKLTEDVLSTLSQAETGQFHIEAGVQTFYSKPLEKVNRSADSQKTLEKLNSLIALKNVDIHTDLIFGLPEQTYDSVIADLNTLIKAGPEEIQLEVLKILPGTPITKTLSNIKYSTIPPYEVLQTDTMSLKEILNLTIISKLIDCFYNHKNLKNIIRYAVINNKDFLNNFLKSVSKALTLPDKPSFKSRINLLLQYATEYNDGPLKELIIFAAFKMGFFDLYKQYSELIKKDQIVYFTDKIISTIYSDSSALLQKPVYLGSFANNAGQLWDNPFEKVLHSNNKYLFRLSQTGLTKKISQIDLIED